MAGLTVSEVVHKRELPERLANIAALPYPTATSFFPTKNGYGVLSVELGEADPNLTKGVGLKEKEERLF